MRLFDNASNFTSLAGTGFVFQTLGGNLVDVWQGTLTGLTTVMAGTAAIQFAQLSAGLALTAGHFLLVA